MVPTRPYRALRALLGTAVIATIVGLWAHAQLTGGRMGTLWEVVMLALVLASAIAVFGRRTVEAAVEASQQLQDQNNDDSTSDTDE